MQIYLLFPIVRIISAMHDDQYPQRSPQSLSLREKIRHNICTDVIVFPQVSPSHVWIKRCVGICDHGSECQPRKTIIRHIPVSTLCRICLTNRHRKDERYPFILYLLIQSRPWHGFLFDFASAFHNVDNSDITHISDNVNCSIDANDAIIADSNIQREDG